MVIAIMMVLLLFSVVVMAAMDAKAVIPVQVLVKVIAKGAQVTVMVVLVVLDFQKAYKYTKY